ncbi:MAG: hypothetical protein PHC51_01965 [bacterium]|nr:hypothetical protein [bacterium]
MKQKTANFLLRKVPLALILFSLLLICGCGGGSSGTGGLKHEGILLSLTGEPISGALVSIAESGDSAYTDNDGFYSFESNAHGDTLTYLFDTPSSSYSSTVTNIQPTTSRIIADFQIDEDSSDIRQTRIEEDDDNDDNNNEDKNNSDDEKIDENESEDESSDDHLEDRNETEDDENDGVNEDENKINEQETDKISDDKQEQELEDAHEEDKNEDEREDKLTDEDR